MQHAVLSYGLGVDSTAILMRWVLEPASRPCPLECITVITAMTGDEFENTGDDDSTHILPLLREQGIRYVQVARRGPKEGASPSSRTRDRPRRCS
jgi:hypothetical protein